MRNRGLRNSDHQQNSADSQSQFRQIEIHDEEPIPARTFLVGYEINQLGLSAYAFRLFACLKAHAGFRGGKA